MKENAPVSERTEKEKALHDMLAEIDTWVDGLGRGLDGGSKEIVAIMNVMGLSTEQSCEGHADFEVSHSLWPWIRLAIPDKPEERFVGELDALDKAYKIVSEQNGVDLDDLMHGEPEDLYWQVQREFYTSEELQKTPEYVDWEEKEALLGERVRSLVDEFNADRDFEAGISLVVDGVGIEVRSNMDKEVYVKARDLSFTDDDIESAKELLPRRQEEMRAFMEFLMKKYFGEI